MADRHRRHQHRLISNVIEYAGGHNVPRQLKGIEHGNP